MDQKRIIKKRERSLNKKDNDTGRGTRRHSEAMKLLPQDPLINKQRQSLNYDGSLSTIGDQEDKPRTKREQNKVTFSPVTEQRQKILSDYYKPQTTEQTTAAKTPGTVGSGTSAMKNSSYQKGISTTGPMTPFVSTNGSVYLQKSKKPEIIVKSPEIKTKEKREQMMKKAAEQVDSHLKMSKPRAEELNKTKSKSPSPPSKQNKLANDVTEMSLHSGYGGLGAPFMLPGFDTSKYKMHNKEDYRSLRYEENFMENLKINKKKIGQQLTQLVYGQIQDHLEGSKLTDGLPKIFEENQNLWSGHIMKNKKLQSIFADFTDKIASHLNHEIRHNEQLATEYMRFPHKHNIQQRQRGSRYGSPTADQFEGCWLPNKESVNSSDVPNFKKRLMKSLEDAAELGKHRKNNTVGEARRTKQQDKLQQAMNIKIAQTAKQIKPLYTPVQEELMEHFTSMQTKIDGLDINNKDLKDKVHEAESGMYDDALELDKTKGANNRLEKKLNEIVGDAYSNQELQKYGSVVWKSLEQFEKTLHARELACETELKKNKAHFESRIDGIRQATSFRIEALEAALSETKLKYAREAERANMIASEMESYLLNKTVDDKEQNKINDEIEKFLNPPEEPEPTSMAAKLMGGQGSTMAKMQQNQMKKLLKGMQKTVDSMKADKVILNNEITELKGEAEKNKKFNDNIQIQQKQSKLMVQYYIDFLIKLLHDVKFFTPESSAPDSDKQLFNELSEMKLVYQRDAAEEEMAIKEGLMEANLPRFVKKLSSYIDDVHAILKMLKVDQLFAQYQLIIEVQQKLQTEMIKNLTDSGLITDPNDPIAMAKKAKLDANPRLKKASMGIGSKVGKAMLANVGKLAINKQDSTASKVDSSAPTSPTSKLPQNLKQGENKQFENAVPLSMNYTEKTDEDVEEEDPIRARADIFQKLSVDMVKPMGEQVFAGMGKLKASMKNKFANKLKIMKVNENEDDDSKEQNRAVTLETKESHKSINKAQEKTKTKKQSKGKSSEATKKVSAESTPIGKQLSPSHSEAQQDDQNQASNQSLKKGSQQASSNDVVDEGSEGESEEETNNAFKAALLAKLEKKKEEVQAEYEKNAGTMGKIRAKEEKRKIKEQKLAAQKEAKEKKKAELALKKAASKSKAKNKQIKVPGLKGGESDDDISSLGTVSLHSEDEESADDATPTPAGKGSFSLAKMDKKVMSRYRKALIASCKEPEPDDDTDLEEKPKGERPLSGIHHDQICDAYRSALKTEIEAKEYTELLESENIDQITTVLNKIWLKYIDYQKQTDDASKLGEKKQSNANMNQFNQKGKPIPFMDCIKCNINEKNGEIQGFTIRPSLIKLMYQRDNFELDQALRLVRTVSQMNRMLTAHYDLYLNLEEEGTIAANIAIATDNAMMKGKASAMKGKTKKKGTKKAPVKVASDQSLEIDYASESEESIDSIKQAKKIPNDISHPAHMMGNFGRSLRHVEQPPMVQHKQMQSSGTMTEEITNEASQPDIEDKPQTAETVSDQVTLFMQRIREHVITVLKREDPDKRGYYNMIWTESNQTFDQLLEYKLPKVVKKVEIKDDASNDSQISLALEMNVQEYFVNLLEILDTKLLTNYQVSSEDKVELNLHKWIWDGGPDMIAKLRPDQIGYVEVQTDKPKLPPMVDRSGIIYISSSSQTTKDLLPQIIVQDQVPVFQEEDIAIQIDSVMGAEIERTVASLQQFVDIQKVNKDLENVSVANSREGPFHKGALNKMKVSVDKKKKETIAESKARRKEIMSNLRNGVKGNYDLVAASVNEQHEVALQNMQMQSVNPKISRNSSIQKQKLVKDYSGSRSPIRYENNSQLPVLDHLVKGNILLGYESEDNHNSPHRNNPFKQVNQKAFGAKASLMNSQQPLNGIDQYNRNAKASDYYNQSKLLGTADSSNSHNQGTFFSSAVGSPRGANNLSSARGTEKNLNIQNFPQLMISHNLASNQNSVEQISRGGKNATMLLGSNKKQKDNRYQPDLPMKNLAPQTTRHQAEKELRMIAQHHAAQQISERQQHTEVDRFLRKPNRKANVVKAGNAHEALQHASYTARKQEKLKRNVMNAQGSLSPRLITPLQAWNNTNPMASIDTRVPTSNSRDNTRYSIHSPKNTRSRGGSSSLNIDLPNNNGNVTKPYNTVVVSGEADLFIQQNRINTSGSSQK